MRILTLVIALLLSYCVNVLGQSNCLESIEVKKANYLLDERDWLIEQAKSDSLTLANRAKEITTLESLLAQSQRESANKDTLILIEANRSADLEQVFNKEQKRVKRRDRLLWIVSAVAVVETVVIGVSIGLSSR
jgi:biopolymer transport protein ExbB/TolQ